MMYFDAAWWPPLPVCDLTQEDYRILTARQRCTACGERRTKEGHDPCIANMPGVLFACCGHGTGDGYIYLESGHIIRGDFDHMRANPTKAGA